MRLWCRPARKHGMWDQDSTHGNPPPGNDARPNLEGAKVDTKVDVELHSSLNSVLISKSNMSKKILDILLQEIRNNLKVVAKRTKIKHTKFIMTSLHKCNVLKSRRR